MAAILAFALVLALASAADVPTVTLYNTAEEGMTMPAIGLGTGGYNSDSVWLPLLRALWLLPTRCIS